MPYIKGLNNLKTAEVIKSYNFQLDLVKPHEAFVVLNYFNCCSLICSLQTAESLKSLKKKEPYLQWGLNNFEYN